MSAEHVNPAVAGATQAASPVSAAAWVQNFHGRKREGRHCKDNRAGLIGSLPVGHG